MDRMQTCKNLLEQIRAGKSAAFGEFYKLFAPGLFQYLRAITSKEDLAEDCLHDVFIDLHRNVDKVLASPHPLNYLFAMARNKVLRVKARNNIEGSALLEENMYISKSNEGLFANNSNLLQLSKALDALPEEQRELVMLHAFRGFTFEEIESITGVSLKTQFSRYQTAIKSLKQFFTRESD